MKAQLLTPETKTESATPMERKHSRKSIQYFIRILHRDIGFLLVGLTMIYALSGILLIYRSTGFLQSETTSQKTVAVGLEAGELGRELGMRHFELEKQDGDTIFFQGGSYDRSSGIATYTQSGFPTVLSMFTDLHKVTSRSSMHPLAAVYAFLLLFLAVSSFWMYKPGTRLFRRSISFSTAGMVVAVVLMFACAG